MEQTKGGVGGQPVKSIVPSLYFLQADLVSTIGESAAMGTAGVVIWERSETKLEVRSLTPMEP